MFPSRFESMRRDMAFSHNKQELVRQDVVRAAESTLNDYLDGREKAYAVYLLIEEITAVFHEAAVIPVQLLHLAIDADDGWQRTKLVTQAMKMLEKTIRNE